MQTELAALRAQLPQATGAGAAATTAHGSAAAAVVPPPSRQGDAGQRRAFAASLRCERTINGALSGAGDLQFARPWDVCVEAGEAGLVYVADCDNHRVQVLTKAGAHVRTLGTTGEAGDGQLQFSDPQGVAVEAGEAGLVYVADRENHRVQVWGGR